MRFSLQIYCQRTVMSITGTIFASFHIRRKAIEIIYRAYVLKNKCRLETFSLAKKLQAKEENF